MRSRARHCDRPECRRGNPETGPGRRPSARSRRTARRTDRGRPRRSRRALPARRSAIALTTSTSCGKRARWASIAAAQLSNTNSKRRDITVGALRIRIKRLTAQQPTAPTRCGLAASPATVLGHVAGDQPRHRGKVEHVAVQRAETRLQGRRLLAGLRMDESRAQDVRQLAHQMVDQRAERGCLLGMTFCQARADEARRQRAARSRAVRRRHAAPRPRA